MPSPASRIAWTSPGRRDAPRLPASCADDAAGDRRADQTVRRASRRAAPHAGPPRPWATRRENRDQADYSIRMPHDRRDLLDTCGALTLQCHPDGLPTLRADESVRPRPRAPTRTLPVSRLRPRKPHESATTPPRPRRSGVPPRNGTRPDRSRAGAEPISTTGDGRRGRGAGRRSAESGSGWIRRVQTQEVISMCQCQNS